MAAPTPEPSTPDYPDFGDPADPATWLVREGVSLSGLVSKLALTPKSVMSLHGRVDPTCVYTAVPSPRGLTKSKFEAQIESKYLEWLEAKIRTVSGLEKFLSESTTDPSERSDLGTQQFLLNLLSAALTVQANGIFLLALRSVGLRYEADIFADRLDRLDYSCRKEIWSKVQEHRERMDFPLNLLHGKLVQEDSSAGIRDYLQTRFPDLYKTPERDQDDDDCPICSCDLDTIQAIMPVTRYLEPDRSIVVWELEDLAHRAVALEGPLDTQTGASRLATILREKSKKIATNCWKFAQSFSVCAQIAGSTKSLRSAQGWGSLVTSFNTAQLQAPPAPTLQGTIKVPQQVVSCGTCKKGFHSECLGSWLATGDPG
ncbi:hypothetical protein PV10_00698 [Exophiala mesophila]|uniref:Uncharacterized protein n=1 Tax=Exophiala mesophila TaxID=212818 RepID=A0A0D1ZSJ2_EXOME|nr:uncharacterized protein PV10_00698 [Exophiala mesophila]KIV96884.1 hypothetical protein PV10_00698 [Exophiala mesophila]